MGVSSTQRAAWSGRIAFILAAAGSAVGLGNLWKFPYIAGTNGGGAFVLVYLACIAIVGIPVFLAELYIGQASQKSAAQAFEALHKKGSQWKLVGVMGVFSSVIILSFYSVVGGWILDFELQSVLNHFGGKPEAEIKGYMGSLISNPGRQLFWHFVFMAASTGVVLLGVKKGIERWNRILMPVLCLLLFILLARTFFLPGFSKAMNFLFSPDASKLSWAGVLEAVGHAFFTLSLGLGAIITYGSYLSSRSGLVKAAVTVAVMDTAIALIAGMIIFAVVFSYDLEAGKGPALMFQTLPVLFSEMPGGYFISVLFFLLVSFAAFTSGISLLEVVVAYLVDLKFATRKTATLVASTFIYLLGILSVLSFNLLSHVKLGQLSLFDMFDKLTSNITLPLGGLLIALYFGWVLGPRAVEASIGKRTEPIFSLILWVSRVGAPIAVAFILGQGVIELVKLILA